MKKKLKQVMFERYGDVLSAALLRSGKDSRVFYVHSGDGNSGYGGQRVTAPLATIDQAINKCTANEGDVIVVLPGHAETISAAGGAALDIAGVTVVGLGHGDRRPTITFATATAASITVSASDCKWMGGFIFKCNIASQNHMFDIAADDFTLDGLSSNGEYQIDFMEGTATGLSFITADTADGDSDYLKLRGFRCYAPTAGNYDNAVQLGKDFVGVRITDFDIYGDFDDAGIHIPAGGNACLDLAIKRGRSVNLLTNTAAISINGTSCTGEIFDVRLGTDTKASALDNGSLRTYPNVTWTDTTDQTIATPIFVEPDSTSNILGADDADNGFASTNVTSNRDGSVLERLEHIAALVAQGQDLIVVKTFTSSSIPNNTQTGGALTGAASGTLVLKEIILQTDSTGLAGPTNIEISTDNAKGLTGAGAPNITTAITGLGANKTVNIVNAASEVLPLYLETGKKLYIHGDDGAGTGGGTVDVIMVFGRVSADATIAAA